MNSFVASRASSAHAAGKPIILEETGMDVRPLSHHIVNETCK
jgi:hypothetical protein